MLVFIVLSIAATLAVGGVLMFSLKQARKAHEELLETFRQIAAPRAEEPVAAPRGAHLRLVYSAD